VKITGSTGEKILSFAYAPTPTVSPLVLADRLLTLAQDAERAGYPETASNLVQVMYSVLDAPRRSA
jgi:hypothetical protein